MYRYNLTEQEQKWSNIITEGYDVKDTEKVAWMSRLAQVHYLKEGQQSGTIATDSSIYATPFGTLGMGNPQMPFGVGYNQGGADHGAGIGDTGKDFHNPAYIKGSGDIPMSTLTMALEVAAMTIGFELVPVIPMTGPWAMLSYMDFPYAGGKLGKLNETWADGKGAGDQNKPIYIKVNAEYTKAEKDSWNVGDDVVIKTTGTGYGESSSSDHTLNGKYLGVSRIDGNIIFKVVSALHGDKEASIAEVLSAGPATVTIGGKKLASVARLRPELVTSAADHIQGFVNFFDGSDEPMTRAQNETGTGNRIGARMFTKMVQAKAYEATGGVTRQQLQDMPLYGVDVIGKVLEHIQNEISQGINNRILDRVFKLGVTNAVNQYKYQGVNLNLYLDVAGSAPKAAADFTAAKKFVGIDEKQHAADFGLIKNAAQNSSGENLHTHQRRIASRVLAAANLVAQVSRRGRAQWLVTNATIATALQDAANYVVAPMTNTLTQDGSQSLYFAGSIAGLNLYVDPYMKWDDNRVCVGRKSNGNDPGVIFMPYILADTVQVVAEGTFAPVLLCNSRYAIVDAGFYPEQSYYTFMVEAAEGFLI